MVLRQGIDIGPCWQTGALFVTFGAYSGAKNETNLQPSKTQDTANLSLLLSGTRRPYFFSVP